MFHCRALSWFLGLLVACKPAPEEADKPAGNDPPSELTSPDDPGESSPTGPEHVTWWRDVAPIVGRNCVSCHRPGDIAPFSLETYADAVTWAEPMRAAVEAGTMPPWPPGSQYQGEPCAELESPRALTDQEVATISAWVDAGAPEGDPADGAEVPPPGSFEGDLQLPMPEPYAPLPAADDYRCFIMEWPGTEPTYITAYQVLPGRADLVHHVILSQATGFAANQARNLDEGQAGPGYACFGSSGVLGAETIGGWVPGVSGTHLPAGTGIRVEPGTTLIMQVHYNTMATADPGEDLTEVTFQLSPSVERPAAGLLMIDLTWLIPGQMAIPAGDPSVTHQTTFSGSAIARAASAIDADPSQPVRLHRMGLHMHTLGKAAALTLERQGGGSSCVLAIPDWDFHWQGSYNLVEPIDIAPQDDLRLRCEWDNSGPGAVNVDWGEGTGDEMCLTSLYVTQ